MSNPTVPVGFLDDAVGRRLRTFAEELEQQLGPAARVERGGTFAGEVDLLPARRDALAVSWIDFGGDDELHLYAGTQGRWELDKIGGEAPVGCLPLPGWRWWGREVRYAPYAPSMI